MTKKRPLALLLTGTLALSIVLPGCFSPEAEAASKPKLSVRKLNLGIGKKKSISIRNTKAKKIKKTMWKSSKKSIVSVKKTGKLSAKLTAKKAGTSKITVKVYPKGKKKALVLTANVTVTTKQKPSVTATSSPATPSGTPASSPLTSPLASPSYSPEAIPAEPQKTPENILEAYDGIFEHMGTCANYYGYGVKKDQLRTRSTLDFIKKQFNSITLENEMKPDSVLNTGWPSAVKKLTVAQAKEQGYYIPENYTESYVPQLNLGTVDSTLETLQAEGLQMRAHTFMWHQQTPTWFFTKDYAGSEKVDSATMDARLDFFVRNVMRHVMDKEKELTGTNGTLIYAWDVVNEYVHRDHDAASISWMDVYGDMELAPSYVKKAFEIAYEELERYGVQDSVILYYNDYDTYECADDIVSLVNYINEDETDSSGAPVKLCQGIGMQSHLCVDYPTLENYEAALDKFLATGLEVSVTELDVSINYVKTGTDEHGYAKWSYQDIGQTDEDQAAYMKSLMEMLVTKQKNRDKSVNPKGIVGVTIWGLFDTCSWKPKTTPLLFGKSIKDPKASYYSFMEAASVWNQ